jgi:Rieske Fe-S protein
MNRDMQSCAGCTTRRAVLASAGAAAATLVAGCQVYGKSSDTGAPPPASAGTTPPASAGTTPPASAGTTPPDDAASTPQDDDAGSTPPAGTNGGGEVLAQVADVPVGGGKVFGDKGIVVTQPQPGTFKAFSAVCTHAGCTVAGVSRGTINCECHGSKFAIADGSVAGGPAPKPLPAMAINVAGGAITLA